MLIAVSQTSDPTGKWNLYSFDTSDDGLNGTPAHTGCPCLPDQPLLGANRDGVFIDTNEFQDNPSFFFNGGQIYALGRAGAGERCQQRRRSLHLERRHGADRGREPPVLGIDPAVRPPSTRGRGTELLMTGGPEDTFQNNAPLDNRIAAWSLTGTGSLGSSNPSVQPAAPACSPAKPTACRSTPARPRRPGRRRCGMRSLDVNPLENDQRQRLADESGGRS